MLIPVVLLLEMSQKECSLKGRSLGKLTFFQISNSIHLCTFQYAIVSTEE